MPVANPLAYLMLCLWPVASWILFTKLDPARALIWTILGAYMLLPPVIAIDLPMVPDFNKYSIANLSAAAAVLFLLGERFDIWPKSRLGQGFLVIFTLSPIATVLTNTDAIYFFQAALPAMRIYDSLAVSATQFIALLPFLLARKFLATDEGMRAILVALVIAGLIYSVPMLWEARMSPQLNLRIYGFFQHDFSQAIRFGGFRPFVFMPHGLWVAFFALMCFVAAVALFRVGPAPERPRQLVILLYLAVVLLFCRSAGPVVYAMALVPLVLFVSRRWQVLISAALVAVVIGYPLLRGLHLVPVDDLLNLALSVNEERGRSLEFRLRNEELLLARAEERPLFGWGLYGRGLLHDPVTGRISIIADGGWIIVLGAFGWFGYIGLFGLLALPVALLAREALRQDKAAISPYTAAVCLLLAFNLVDLLPNDTHIPFTWLMAGAILGRAEALRAAYDAQRKAAFEARLPAGRTVL
ncbi:MAG: hypothetical protein MUC82_14020 [Cypionkella sp.]|nr:hypothetical protein [Cypionkella sp.]